MTRPEAPGEIDFYEADPRAILPMDGLRVPRSVRRGLARLDYEIRVSTAFDEVVRLCAGPRTGGTWLSAPLADAYRELNRAGFAQSVECWCEGRLAGGLFGVSIGALFTSESMFHRRSDAGNAALVAAHGVLSERGVTLWDVQVASPHVRRFGALEISPAEYRRLLAAALAGGLQPVFA
jgi:leucyl/phenylalanyl-tRNA--protein transferase